MLYQRLSGDNRRPLLRGVDVGEKIDQLLLQRSALYEGTAHEIVVGQDSVPRLTHRIRERLPAGRP